jgi:hypothetical protein
VRLRWAAIGATILLHAVALLFLGPLGHNNNFIVWPWNFAMMALVCALFMQAKSEGTDCGFKQSFAQLRRSKLVLVVLALYSCLPALSYAGWWDSYFSFSLYAHNLATANIFVTQAFADRLPPKVRAQVIPFPFGPKYDPDFQGPFLFDYVTWCWHDLGVPVVPEPRVFHSMFVFLRKYSREPGDLRMMIGQPVGPVIFYEGDERIFLTPK